MRQIKRIAVYCRVSTEKCDQKNSMQSQKSYFAKFAADNGYELVEIYTDEGVSGTSTKNRDEFNRMMKHADLGLFDTIITKEVSRFARNTVTTLEYTRKLKEKGVGVLFLNDNIYTPDNDGELRLTIMASMAQDESRKTSERVQWGQRRQMEKGVVFGGSMLGYDVSGTEMTIVPEEAEIVRMIFRLYLDEEMGASKIAKHLEDSGVRTKRGCKKWTFKKIYDILKNEKYCGDLKQQKTFTPDYLTHQKKRNTGEKEFVYIKDHHAAVVSRETFEQAQDEIKRRRTNKKAGANHSNRYSLSGKLKCGLCGSSYIARSRPLKDGTRKRIWVCSNYHKYGAKKLNGRGEEVGCLYNNADDTAILLLFEHILKEFPAKRAEIRADLIGKIKSVLGGRKTGKNEADKLCAHINKLEQKKLNANSAYLDGVYSKEELAQVKSQIDDEIFRKKDMLIIVKSRESEQADNRAVFDEICAKIDRFIENPAESMSVCRKIIDRIIVRGADCCDLYLKGIDGAVQKFPIYDTKRVRKNWHT